MSPVPPAKPVLLVALGGNALIREGQKGTAQEQFDNLRVPMRQIAKLTETYRIVITHGNGPQVGNLMLQQESCPEVPRMPLEILVAQSQGQIGYMIESTLDSELMALGIVTQKCLVSLISYVVVDPKDPAFADPSKPVGPVYPEDVVPSLPFPVKKTPQGYRRVVASPRPITIVEQREIRKLIAMDFVVICCGGGGIPVVREGRSFCGVDAVIDKDLASAKLARQAGIDIFCIATNVPGVYLDYGTPRQRFLPHLTADEAQELLAQGQFPAGSMGPKVEAAVEFVQATGKRAAIGPIEDIAGTVAGTSGTQITLRP